MDEPFTGLDPVNLALLREAFLELRDRGKTIVFSTHQMEAVEALCESVAIVDHGRVVAGGTLRDVKRATGRERSVWASRATIARLDRGCAGASTRAPGRRARRAGARHRGRARRGPRGGARSRREGHPLRDRRPSLEAVFIEHVGHPPDDEASLATRHGRTGRSPSAASPDGPARAAACPTPRSSPAASTANGPEPAVPRLDDHPMARDPRRARPHRDPLPRPPDDDRIAVVARGRRAGRAAPSASSTACSTSRRTASTRRPGAARSSSARPRRRRRAADLAGGTVAGVMTVTRLPTGQIDVGYRTDTARHRPRSQLVGFGALALGILDWTSTCPKAGQSPRSRRRRSTRVAKSPAGRRQPIAPAGVRQPPVPRRRVRRPDLHDGRHLRHVGRDRRRRREEQPGHGAA